MKTLINIFFIMACLVFNPLTAVDVPVPANSSGSTGNSSQLQGASSWTSNFKLSWNITQTGNLFHYVYTISNNSGGALSKGVQYLILEVSPFVTSSNLNSLITTTSPAISGVQTFSKDSMPGAPDSLYGIKFNFSGNTTALVDFTSSLAPMWGDFYANGSKNSAIVNVYAYNSNFGSDPNNSTQNFSGWVPVPGALFAAVPEPETWLILSSILMMSALIMTRRRSIRS